MNFILEEIKVEIKFYAWSKMFGKKEESEKGERGKKEKKNEVRLNLCCPRNKESLENAESYSILEHNGFCLEKKSKRKCKIE